jgi:2-polyprenyl-3-methyl-5-hydroxy-6-metoxy-1,4-benzoquinol methylase
MSKTCILCGSRNTKLLFLGHDRMYGVQGTFRVVRCRHCGLSQLDPQPSAQELAKYYPAKYYAYGSYNPKRNQERFTIFLYKLFFGEKKGNLLLRLAFLPFKHLLRGTRIIPGGKILDVGCGSGSFLYKMRAAGMDAYGVEPSREGCAQARKLGLNVRQGTLEAQKYPPRFFDIITLNHVFEHVSQPVHTLRELKRILRKGGRLIIAVPNAHSLAAFMFGRNWVQWDVPRHLVAHTPKTMRLAAKKAGLHVRGMRYVSFPGQFQGSIANVLNKQKLADSRINNSRLLYWLFMPFVYVVDFLHMGDVIEVTLTEKKK